MRRRTLLCGAVAATFSGSRASARAQGFPSKVIRILVPFSAGSGTDVVARLLARELGPRLGQNILVENQTGAGGNMATASLARAEPDGHTLLLTTTAHAIAPNLQKSLPFDAVADFAPVTLVCSGPLVLTANPAFAAKTVGDLIALAKAKPGTINYASSGTGTTPHLAVELLKIKAGIDLVHVPYRGGNPAMVDVLANVVPLYFASPATAMPMVESGQVRALGLSSAERPSFIRDIPTIAEQGVPGYRVDFWYGLLAPAKTPRSTVDRLQRETAEILRKPEVIAQLHKLGFDPTATTPEAFGGLIRDEIALWAEVTRTAKISLE
ncbi:Bug family tripartite tricarboxylate transporter substrate binding protein [uncultured Enterovirga sp.]|uniref:Bug family tripartite tricarboxylate transporter substrate binding protein n=1 Tax=uncultured Enterovirga sp. TaxID=2026352 RepID=UPI0035CC6F2F